MLNQKCLSFFMRHLMSHRLQAKQKMKAITLTGGVMSPRTPYLPDLIIHTSLSFSFWFNKRDQKLGIFQVFHKHDFPDLRLRPIKNL